MIGTVVLAGLLLASTAGARAADATGAVFSPSSSAAGATGVQWGFRFEPSSAYKGAVTISMPHANVFSKVSIVLLSDMTSRSDTVPSFTVGASGATLTLATGSSIKPGDVVGVDVFGVVNPKRGMSFKSIAVNPVAVPLATTGQFTAAQSISGLRFTTSTSAAAATGVTWGFRFRTSSTGGLAANSGAITVTAPAGARFNSAVYFNLVDLTTGENMGVPSSTTLSQGGRTATVVLGQAAIPAGDLVELNAFGSTNPASGTGFSAFSVSTSSDPPPVHPSPGTFGKAGAVSGVTFVASTAAGSASANWGLAFKASSSGRLLNNGSITVSGPAGTRFTTDSGNYTITDLSTGSTTFGPESIVTKNKDATAMLDLPSGANDTDDIRAGDEIAVEIQGVKNPAAGITAPGVSLATSSDPTAVPAKAPAQSASGSVAGLELFQTTDAAAASDVVWSAQFATSTKGAIAANSGTVTLTAPSGTFNANTLATLIDLTSGRSQSENQTASADGSTLTIPVTFAIAAGDLLELEAAGSVNPAAASYPATAFGVKTSADTTVAHPASGVTLTAPHAAGGVTVSQNTVAAKAQQTTWTVEFTTSATGGVASNGLAPGQIEVDLPPGSDVPSATCIGFYDLTTGLWNECPGDVTVGGTSAVLPVPTAVSPGDVIDLLLLGATNPGAGSYQANSFTVTTSSDSSSAHPAPALAFTSPNLPLTDVLQDTDARGSAADNNLISEFQTSPTGALSGTLFNSFATLTALPGTKYPSAVCVQEVDITYGEQSDCSEGVTSSGPAATTGIGFPVGSGDVVELGFYGVTNPAGGLVPPTHFYLTTSSDDGSPTVHSDSFTGTEGAPATGATITIDGWCPAAGTVGWGDGSASQAAVIECEGLIASLVGTHTYHEFGGYTTSGSAEKWSGTGRATIGDAPLKASSVNALAATVGIVFKGTVAHFRDANPFGRLSDYSATIAWGDGTSSSDTSITPSGKGFAVHAAHTYEAAMVATVVITVRDRGGSSTRTVESLTVDPNSAPAVTLTTPANGITVTTATPTFAGAAGTNPEDEPQITVNVYAAGAVSGLPVETFIVTASKGAWSVTPLSALANGTYTAQAEQSTTTGLVGMSTANVFMVNASGTSPGGGTGPGTGGGPPPGCDAEQKFHLIDALGCLQAVIDSSQVPTQASQALCAHIKFKKRKKRKPTCSEYITFLAHHNLLLLASSLVRVNGLDISPASGAVVLFDESTGWVTTTNSTVEILGDKVPLYSGPLALNGKAGGDVSKLDANLTKLAGSSKIVSQALNLAGFQLTGTLSVTLQKDVTQLSATVSLPLNLFSTSNGSGGSSGGAVSAAATATADDQDDIQFNELYFDLNPSSLLSFGGAFSLGNVSFCWQNHIADNFCQQKSKVAIQYGQPGQPAGTDDSWTVTASVRVDGFGVNATPPPPANGLTFVNGNFYSGGFTINLGQQGVELAPCVSLTSAGGSLRVDPFGLSLSAGIAICNILDLKGTLFFVTSPYTFTGTELGKLDLPPGYGLPQVSVQSWAFAVGGTVNLDLGGLASGLPNVPLGGGYLLYDYPAYLSAGGGFDVNLFSGKLAASGALQGAINFNSGQFNLTGELSASTNLLGGISLQGSGVVSSTGIATCGEVQSKLFGSGMLLVGYKWGQSFPPTISTNSCALTPWTVVVPSSTARAGAGAIQLSVAHRLPDEMVELPGAAGAPDVRISGPGGISASTAGGTETSQPPFAIVRDPTTKTTLIAIRNPPAGRYTITANPGSAPITEVLDAHGFTPRLRVRVRGQGRHRRLDYRINSQPGEVVTFAEHADGIYHALGSTRRSHGVLKFAAAGGPGGLRQIVATIAEQGVPVPLGAGTTGTDGLVVGSYRAPGPRRLSKVRGLRARRSGDRLLISFDRVGGAKLYLVLVTLRDGLRTDYVIRRHRLSVTVPTVGPLAGKVLVRAAGDKLTTLSGPAANANIRVPKPRRRRHSHSHR